MIDERFSGTAAGYDFSVTVSGNGQEYDVTAMASASTAGRYGYYSSSDSVIRYSTNAARAPSGQAGQPVQ